MNKRCNGAHQRARRQRRISFMELGNKGEKNALAHHQIRTPAHQYKPRQSDQ